MKKTFLILVILMISLISLGQSQSTTLEQGSVFLGKVKWEIVSHDNVSTSCYISFQNAKYQYIHDLGWISLSSREELESFLADADIISKLPYNDNTSTTLGYFRIRKGTNYVVITDDDDAFTTIPKKSLIKLNKKLSEHIDLLKN